MPDFEKWLAAQMKKASRRPFNSPGKGHQVRNVDDDTLEILIYDMIDACWGVSAQGLVREIKDWTGDKIHVRINSPGGSVFEGLAIYNALRNHSSKVTTFIEGLAASAASTVALAGDKVVIDEAAYFMMHNPTMVTWGDAQEHLDAAEFLEKVTDTIADIYAAKSGKMRAEIIELMDAETWLNGAETASEGFADEVRELARKDGAENSFDLTLFNNVPDALLNSKPATEPEQSAPEATQPEPTDQPEPASPAAIAACTEPSLVRLWQDGELMRNPELRRQPSDH